MRNLTGEFDAREHFGGFAERYNQDAFEAGEGVRSLSRRELRVVRSRLGDVRDKTILDAGVGTGRFASMLEGQGANVVGLDVTPEMLARCSTAAPKTRVILARIGQKLPLRDSCVDAAICMRVIKYVSDWDVAMSEFRRALRPRGLLILEIANRISLARLGYRGLPIHFASVSETCDLIERHGMRVRTIDPGPRMPFPVYRWAVSSTRLHLVEGAERLARLAVRSHWLSRSVIFTCSVEET